MVMTARPPGTRFGGDIRVHLRRGLHLAVQHDGEAPAVVAHGVAGQFLGDLLELGCPLIVELEGDHPLAHPAGAHPPRHAARPGAGLNEGGLGVGEVASQHPGRGEVEHLARVRVGQPGLLGRVIAQGQAGLRVDTAGLLAERLRGIADRYALREDGRQVGRPGGRSGGGRLLGGRGRGGLFTCRTRGRLGWHRSGRGSGGGILVVLGFGQQRALADGRRQHRPEGQLAGRTNRIEGPRPIGHSRQLDLDAAHAGHRDLGLLHAPQGLNAAPDGVDGQVEYLGVGARGGLQQHREATLQIETQLGCDPQHLGDDQ
jgi:hypothetical protein